MKTLGRIVMILIAVLVVVGVAYAALSSLGNGQSNEQGEAIGQSNPPTQMIGSNSFAGERIDRGHDQGGSLETVASNFMIIAAIIFVVQGVWVMVRTINKHYLVRS